MSVDIYLGVVIVPKHRINFVIRPQATFSLYGFRKLRQRQRAHSDRQGKEQNADLASTRVIFYHLELRDSCSRLE